MAAVNAAVAQGSRLITGYILNSINSISQMNIGKTRTFVCSTVVASNADSI